MEIATTVGDSDGADAIEALSACRMSEPRSKQCADSYFLLKVAFADAVSARRDDSKGKQSVHSAAAGVGAHMSNSPPRQESTTCQSESGPADGSAKTSVQPPSGGQAVRRTEAKDKDPPQAAVRFTVSEVSMREIVEFSFDARYCQP
eukprot:2581483-Rhodomonas_salina.2